jgi:hypothetical protein
MPITCWLPDSWGLFLFCRNAASGSGSSRFLDRRAAVFQVPAQEGQRPLPRITGPNRSARNKCRVYQKSGLNLVQCKQIVVMG